MAQTTVHPTAILDPATVVGADVEIGRQAMIGGGSRVPRDVPPFFMLRGDALLPGINLVGMKRGGFERDAIREVQRIYDL